MDKLIEQQGIDAYIETEFPLTVFKSWGVVLGFFSEVKSKADKDSQEIYDKLPEMVKVYRGILVKDNHKSSIGVSWTIDVKVAYMFALRFQPLGGDAIVYEGEIYKKDILFFTNAREESEVILNPDDMIWVEEKEIKEDK